MKMDRIAFATLAGFIADRFGARLDQQDVQALDDMIDIEVPVPPAIVPNASESDVIELLRQISHPDGFIPAIKAYRVLTGAGLRESKEAIERYRLLPKKTAKQLKTEMLAVIDNQIDDNYYDRHPPFVLKDFTNSELETVRKFVDSFND
jgi:ribosomal protein L7/L12